MDKKIVQSLYKKAREKWGVESQLLMCAEECSELTHAVLKYLRTGDDGNFIEEIADVELMLGQVHYQFPGFKVRVEAVKEVKLKRLQELLKD